MAGLACSPSPPAAKNPIPASSSGPEGAGPRLTPCVARVCNQLYLFAPRLP